MSKNNDFNKKATKNKKAKKKAKPLSIKGTLSRAKRGFGFVVPENALGKAGSDIFVAERNLHGAMHGDTVEVLLHPDDYMRDGTSGEVTKVLKRANTEIIGTFEKSKSVGFVVSDNRKIQEDVYIAKKDFKGAEQGDKVVVQITKYPDDEIGARGKIVEIIGRAGEAGSDIKALVRQKNLRDTFPSRAMAEAKAVSKMGSTAAGVVGGAAGSTAGGAAGSTAGDAAGGTTAGAAARVDLRDKTIFTIDGADAKDLDDAVSIEKTENGNYILGVHIADVSHYVAEDGPLDKEALKRGNSVYLIDQVIPMLPKELSNGICSLTSGEDRLTLSIDMEITPKGDVVSHKIYEAVIRTCERMTYTDVSDILENEDVDLIKRYQNIYRELLLMNELAKVLKKKRVQRGSLDFDLDESYIRLDASGKVESVGIAERRTANGVIEEFMLVANETVAERFFWLEAPFVYRVHEKPSLEKMEEFKVFIKNFGLTLKGNTENIHPRVLGELLSQTEGKPYENVVNTIMLRSMKKAFYSAVCDGHFGLGLKYYCHFTSPIRRYPDLIIHRIIKETLREPLSDKRKKALRKKVEKAAETASATERQALELEREVEKMKKTEYMAGLIGEEFEGVISGVTAFGLYVELPNTIEGMVRLDMIDYDDYDFDSQNYRVIGRMTKKVYALGDEVRVIVRSANIAERQIDFQIRVEEKPKKRKK